jgi:hypothetical protein
MQPASSTLGKRKLCDRPDGSNSLRRHAAGRNEMFAEILTQPTGTIKYEFHAL